MKRRRLFDPALDELAAIAELLGAKMGAGQAQTAVLGANTNLTLGALTNLLAANVWLPGVYLVAATATYDAATVAGNVDTAVVAAAGTTIDASHSTSVAMPAAAATAITASLVCVVNVLTTPATTAPQGINAGQPGGPGGLILQAFAAAGTTGVRARQTSSVNGYAGATSLTIVQLD